MRIELRLVTENDGVDVYDMLQEMPLDKNGFQNGGHGKTTEEYMTWLRKSVAMSQGENLESWQVPQSSYWLYVDGFPVGFGKLRHRLTEALMAVGGHIGYGIRPSQRGKGYGKQILKLLLRKARELGIDKSGSIAWRIMSPLKGLLKPTGEYCRNKRTCGLSFGSS